MSQYQDKFEDAELKAALQRAWPREAASAALRRRIAQACSESANDGPIPLTHERDSARWWQRGRAAAVAASIAGLGLGIGLYFAANGPVTDSGLATHTPAVSIDTALVRHGELQRYASNPQMRRGLLDYNQVKQQVRANSPIYLPNPDLSNRGWEFVGAKPFETDEAIAAQLFYTRGNQSMSVFVLPSGYSAMPMRQASPEYACATRGTSRNTFFVLAQSPDRRLTATEMQMIADDFARR